MPKVRLIDGDRLAEIFEEAAERGAGVLATVYRDAAHFARTAPEIKPEVQRGRWIEKPPYADETVKGLEFQIVCSECDEQNASITFDDNSVPIAKTFYRTRYCPNCGAKMGRGADNA